MGIKGIYHEIGPGERIALQKLAVETYQTKGRPLRLAIDISIWLFQIQSGKGGTNPALRTFYYRLLRLIAFSIHPLFVFDGPNKPPFKRDKRTGPNVASIPDFLAKQLLKKFAIPFHIAPGEAEAECALLQQKGLVDAVLSEDVDTLMFGCGLTLRSWSAEPGSGTQTRTHVNLYDAEKTKAGMSGLDRPGMILVAMMSGGDYLPEGIPGCGPKTACEAARAGFGADLCKISRHDRTGIAAWKERLCHELKSNESKHFTKKHRALVIPEEFPRMDILGYYTMPVISTDTQLQALKTKLVWDQQLDLDGLRSFCGDAFDWVCISGAKKFVRNIAPCVLIKELRLRADQDSPSQIEAIKDREGRLVKGIHGKRSHKSTDASSELRVSFIPIELVKIDLDAEDPDPEIPAVDLDADEEETVSRDAGEEPNEPSSPRKRAPSKYDPTQLEKIWLLDSFVKVGVPLMAEDYEEDCRRIEAAKAEKEAAKASRQATKQAAPAGKKKTAAPGGMQRGALDRFTRITKPGISSSPPVASRKVSSVVLEDPFRESRPARPVFRPPRPLGEAMSLPQSTAAVFIDLLSSPEQATSHEKRTFCRTLSDTDSSACITTPTDPPGTMPVVHEAVHSQQLPTSVSIRRPRSPLRRTQTMPNPQDCQPQSPTTTPRSRHQVRTATDVPFRSTTKSPGTPRIGRTGPNTGFSPGTDPILISSSPVGTPHSTRQRSITDWISPSKQHVVERPCAAVATLDLSGALDDEELTGLDFGSSKLPKVIPAAVLGTLPAQSVLQGHTKQKRTVRIRESLGGSWALEVQAVQQATPQAKRTKRGLRVFRMSEVAVLDMTNDD